MLASSVFGTVMQPTQKLAELHPREKLETLVPMQFADWKGTSVDSLVVPDPQMLATLEAIYTETLSRTYVDSHGRQIMLSIAYGADQRDGMEMHYPEICYPAQGFQSRSVHKELLATPFGSIQVKRLEMTLGQRHELVTYWTVIGEYATLGGTGKKLNEMRYSLKGVIPDGLLFRVSTIGQDTEGAYRDHGEFVGALLGALAPVARKRLAGL